MQIDREWDQMLIRVCLSRTSGFRAMPSSQLSTTYLSIWYFLSPRRKEFQLWRFCASNLSDSWKPCLSLTLVLYNSSRLLCLNRRQASNRPACHEYNQHS
ncbi:hypothetical protein FGO68_gene776 [Halteria grandinella]|uniref:Uncharacterized protein n=1 Tax=Halteria grandinella TaxID=5974 RepID=A0A8J8T8R5_HALGN|nr:hypothetical protein FGO68_gene776 [Halteria grandinella]